MIHMQSWTHGTHQAGHQIFCSRCVERGRAYKTILARIDMEESYLPHENMNIQQCIRFMTLSRNSHYPHDWFLSLFILNRDTLIGFISLPEKATYLSNMSTRALGNLRNGRNDITSLQILFCGGHLDRKSVV